MGATVTIKIKAKKDIKICACHYCGNPNIVKKPKDNLLINLMTVDHVIPISKGGKNENNLIIACSYCNKLKGSKSYEEFTKLRKISNLYIKNTYKGVEFSKQKISELTDEYKDSFILFEKVINKLRDKLNYVPYSYPPIGIVN